jgi:ABC-2 type transport system permease protein
MSIITTTPDPALPRAARHGDAGFLTTARQSARRTLLQYARNPQLGIMPPVMSALFLIIFRYVFGGAIEPGGEISYVNFLIPGFLAQTILWTGMNIPAGVAEDAAAGIHDRLRSMPIPRAAIMAGRALADCALNVWALAITVGLGYAVGFQAQAGPGDVLLAFGVMLVAIYAFSWFFIMLGLLASNAQGAQALSSLLVIPFTFVSGAFVPVESMPGWMEPFAANQPVTVMINAVRSLMLGGTDAAGVGHTTTYWVTLSLIWCAAILIVSAVVAVRRFGRTR